MTDDKLADTVNPQEWASVQMDIGCRTRHGIGAVRLQVSDLARSLGYYTTVLGLRVLSQNRLGGGAWPEVTAPLRLIELHERRGARPVPRRGAAGPLSLRDPAARSRVARTLRRAPRRGRRVRRLRGSPRERSAVPVGSATASASRSTPIVHASSGRPTAARSRWRPNRSICAPRARGRR